MCLTAGGCRGVTWRRPAVFCNCGFAAEAAVKAEAGKLNIMRRVVCVPFVRPVTSYAHNKDICGEGASGTRAKCLCASERSVASDNLEREQCWQLTKVGWAGKVDKQAEMSSSDPYIFFI